MKLLPIILGLVIGVLGIAAGAIGIQYYNKCDKLHDEKSMKRNRNFLIFFIIFSILTIAIGFFLGFRNGKKVIKNNRMEGAPVVPPTN